MRNTVLVGVFTSKRLKKTGDALGKTINAIVNYVSPQPIHEATDRFKMPGLEKVGLKVSKLFGLNLSLTHPIPVVRSVHDIENRAILKGLNRDKP